ncbi:MAG: pitrilysin family protein [bacterium]
MSIYKKHTLSNNLRILTIPLANTKTATILVLVKAGSKNENKRINGISHFLEHMFFKGTKKRPVPLDIAKAFDEIGGEYNAFTSQEYTGFYAKVNWQHFYVALDLLSDMILNSKFDKDDIERERGVIIEEINMYQDTPMEYISTLWCKILYGDQPAGWDIAGAKKTVSKISRSDMVMYYSNYYIPKNTLICAAGKLPRDLMNNITGYFNYKKNYEDINKHIPVKESQEKPQILLKYKKTDQTHLMLGVRGYNMFHKDRFAIKLLSIILGGGMSSRLFMEIREKKGLAYYIYTKVESDSDTGFLVSGAGLDNKKVYLAVKIILDEYRKIAIEGVEQKELEKSKEFLKGKMVLNLESSDEWANFIASQELLREEILSLDEIFAKIEKVRVEDIKRVAKDIFIDRKLNLALIGPFKDKYKFEDILTFAN